MVGMRIGKKDRGLFVLEKGLLRLPVPNSTIAQQTNRRDDAPKASTKVAKDNAQPQSMRTAKDGWVPPDIEAVRPPVANEPSCPLRDVTSKAGKRVEPFVDNLNRLTATEIIDHQTASYSGTLHHPEIQRSKYVVSASRARDGNVHFVEYRGRSLKPEPSSDQVVVTGAFSLLLIFHPYHANDFQMTCEGLAAWHGQPAWQIRFEEQSKRMERLVMEGKESLHFEA
jgi:hypothetical protein